MINIIKLRKYRSESFLNMSEDRVRVTIKSWIKQLKN